MNKKLIETIEILVKAIPKDVKWGFSDGTAAFFYGSEREPTDLDIFTDNYGVKKIAEVLNEFLLTIPKKESKQFFERRSLLIVPFC
jgi:hypothetical protein